MKAYHKGSHGMAAIHGYGIRVVLKKQCVIHDRAGACAGFLRNYARENLFHEAGAVQLETIYQNSRVPSFFGPPFWRWIAERREMKKRRKSSPVKGAAKESLQ